MERPGERSRPEGDRDAWLIRDLPSVVDSRDEDGIYGTKFGELWMSDTEYEWPNLIEWYRYSDANERAAINRVFVYLIGYTLPSLVQLAHGATEADLP